MADSGEVFMNVPAVQGIANQLKQFADILNTIGNVLSGLAKALHATAFFSFGATEAEAQFIDRILPKIKKQKEKMEGLSKDVNEAIKAYQTGDTSGKSRFS
jgi:metal-dependent HD superfamily phosphatase/phosphodiesterase